jgi:hypothetical protein
MTRAARPRIDYIEPALDQASYPYHLRPDLQTWELRLVSPEAEKTPPAKLEGTISQGALLAQVCERLGDELAPWLASSRRPDSEFSSGPGAGVPIIAAKPDLSDPPAIGNPFGKERASSSDEGPDITIVQIPPRKNSKLPARKPTKVRVALRVPPDLLGQASLLAALERAVLGAGVVGSENFAMLATPLATIAYQRFLQATTLSGAQEAGDQYRGAVSVLFESFAASGGTISPGPEANLAGVRELLSLSDPELYLFLTEARYPGNGRGGEKVSRWPAPFYATVELEAALNRLLTSNILELVYRTPGYGYVWQTAHDILTADPCLDLNRIEFMYRRTERFRRGHLSNNAGRILGLF